MTFDEAILVIKSFWQEPTFPFVGHDISEAKRIATEWNTTLPTELNTYLLSYAPNPAFYFANVGNSTSLYSPPNIQKLALGYNFNPLTNQNIAGWNDNWILIGDEGADPIIIDLSAVSENGQCAVFKAGHGCGEWDFSPMADSLSQFILLQSALHHALVGFDIEDSIIDDQSGFNLAPQPASWLFPLVKKYAGSYYDDWVNIFDNA